MFIVFYFNKSTDISTTDTNPMMTYVYEFYLGTLTTLLMDSECDGSEQYGFLSSLNSLKT